MKFIESVTDAAERIADQSTDTADAIAFLNVFAAQNIVVWARDRDENGYTADNAKALVTAATAFLGAASLSGLDLDSALRELCLQAEEGIGGQYLDGFEREAAQMARDNEDRAKAAETVRSHLARLYGEAPLFSRVA